MRILLIAPHWLFVYEQYGELSKAVNFHPPLGLCALSAAAERAGHTARVLDAEGQGLSVDDLVAAAVGERADVVGITVTTPVLESAAKVAAAIKAARPQVTVVVGGPHVTLTGAEILDASPAFDVAMSGEGEATFPQLLAALRDNTPVGDVPGSYHRGADGAIVAGPGNNAVLELDELPVPDRTKLDGQRYMWSVPGVGLVPMASLQASRGCPLRCIFCSEDRMYPKVVRWKSVDRVLAELETIRRTTPARHIVFLDDTITLHRTWALDLFRHMRDARLDLTWEGETTANRVDEELVEAMVQSGLKRINFGIESGDPDILARLGKGVPLAAIAPAYALMKRYGVETRGSVILGNPYETRATVWRTLRFIWRLKDLDQAYINIATPYPGTILRDMALRGEGGVTLLDERYEALRRYGGGVMRVNDLTPAYLNRVQRLGTFVFYAQPRRVVYNLRRSGPRAMWRNLRAFARSLTSGSEGPVQVASGI